jgi:alanine dehydrogenase
VHVTCVKRSELGQGALERCDRIVVHESEGAPVNYLVGIGDVPVPAQDPLELLRKIRAGETVSREAIDAAIAETPGPKGEPLLEQVITGEIPGRQDDREINAFVNNIGIGIQFAAVGELAYRRARERGLGQELPTEWFTENVHP